MEGKGKLGRSAGLGLVTLDAVQASKGFRGQIVADAGKGYLAQLVLYLELFVEEGQALRFMRGTENYFSA